MCIRDSISAVATRVEPITERDRLLFLHGVGERTVLLLEEAGYRTIEEITREDEDKLAIKTGLGIKKARALKQGAESFLANEWSEISQALKKAQAQHQQQAQQAQAQQET